MIIVFSSYVIASGILIIYGLLFSFITLFASETLSGRKQIYLFLFFSLSFLPLFLYNPFSDSKENKEICNSLNLDISQCSVKPRINIDSGNLEISIVFFKYETCPNFINLINNKEKKCTKTHTVVFYDYKPINFILKTKVEDILIAFDSKKDKIQSIKNDFFKEVERE